MSSIWGVRLKISLFGESHGPGIGEVLDGFPPGLELDFEKISLEMERRKPKSSAYSTRREPAIWQDPDMLIIPDLSASADTMTSGAGAISLPG